MIDRIWYPHPIGASHDWPIHYDSGHAKLDIREHRLLDSVVIFLQVFWIYKL